MASSDDRSAPRVSDRKLAANRANAQKSTGPRTAEGKARSAMNAALFAESIHYGTAPDESARRFTVFASLVRADLRPANIVQEVLVDRATHLMWKMRRVQAAQSAYLLDEVSEGMEFLEEERAAGRDTGDAEAYLFHASHILLESMKQPRGRKGAFLRLDVYADQLQRALVAVLRRLRQEQDRTGEGDPPDDEVFSLRALRRTARATLARPRRGAQKVSEATACGDGPGASTAATGAPAGACGGTGATGAGAPEKINRTNEPTDPTPAARSDGGGGPCMN